MEQLSGLIVNSVVKLGHMLCIIVFLDVIKLTEGVAVISELMARVSLLTQSCAAAVHCYKVCLTGAPGVGKSSLFMRIKTGRFHEVMTTSLTVDTHVIYKEVEGNVTGVIYMHIFTIIRCTLLYIYCANNLSMLIF